MAQKVEDFNLPYSAISKIVKEAIPEGVRVTDKATLALSKAASVFVLYTTSSANSLSQDDNRKRILSKDMYDALKDLDLDFLIQPLQTSLSAYHDSLESKKQEKENKRISFHTEEVILDENDSTEAPPVQSSVHTPVDVIVIDSSSESESESRNEDLVVDNNSD